MTTRKPRAKNWSAEETEKLLDLRFNDEEILYKLSKSKEKKDEADIWEIIGAKITTDLSTPRDGTQCKDRLRTLIASYKKLRVQTSKTGNARLSLPPYWEKLCNYLTPYEGMRGECTMDSLSGGTSASLVATTLMTTLNNSENEEPNENDKDSNEESQVSLFSPNKKRKVGPVTKKGKELAEACDAMKTLANHIISKNDDSTVKVEMAQIASRVEVMESKMDAIIDILTRKNK
jgi:hypothetical protein